MDNTKIDNTYTFDKKKKLMERINKLSSKAEFEQVKKIILEKNPELDSMKNQNGLFLQFNYLNNETYIGLTSYLDKLEKLKLKKMREELLETSEALSDDDTFTNNNSDKNMSKKLRLTNTESHIINRVKYEKELKKNENMTDVDELNIYDPELSHKKPNIFVSITEDPNKVQDKKKEKKEKKIVVKTEDQNQDNNETIPKKVMRNKRKVN